MPICYVTLSEMVETPNKDEFDNIRDIVAQALLSNARYLDRNHIVLRIQKSQRCFMLGEIEIIYLPNMTLKDILHEMNGLKIFQRMCQFY
jgi:hypothetical protein